MNGYFIAKNSFVAEVTFKMMRNAFYFILKALFVTKMFNTLS